MFAEEKELAIEAAIEEIKNEERRKIAKSLLDVLTKDLIAEKFGLSSSEMKEIEKEYQIEQKAKKERSIEIATSLLDVLAVDLIAEKTGLAPEQVKEINDQKTRDLSI